MKNVKSVIYIMFLMLVVVSCDDDDLLNPNNPSSSGKPVMADYFPDSTANYWIYDTYQVDTLGVERFVQTDSVIVSDTVINNLTYKYYRSTTNNSIGRIFRKVLRDSSGYKVTETGRILFTLQEFDTVLEADTFQNIGTNIARMRSETKPILTPIGSYDDVMNYEVTFTFTVPHPSFLPQSRVADNIYVRDIGLVYASYFYSSAPGRFEQRLRRYSVK